MKRMQWLSVGWWRHGKKWRIPLHLGSWIFRVHSLLRHQKRPLDSVFQVGEPENLDNPKFTIRYSFSVSQHWMKAVQLDSIVKRLPAHILFLCFHTQAIMWSYQLVLANNTRKNNGCLYLAWLLTKMDRIHLYLCKLGDVKQAVRCFSYHLTRGSTQQHLGHLYTIYHLCSRPLISKQPTLITRARQGPAFSP